VGAVFNRDYPGNRGRRPLPPSINHNLNDFELYEVSYDDLILSSGLIKSILTYLSCLVKTN